jgi:hypothetical protein
MRNAELPGKLGQLIEDAASGVHLSVLLLLTSTAAAAETPWDVARSGLTDLHVWAALILLVRLMHSLLESRRETPAVIAMSGPPPAAVPQPVKRRRKRGRKTRRARC